MGEKIFPEILNEFNWFNINEECSLIVSNNKDVKFNFSKTNWAAPFTIIWLIQLIEENVHEKNLNLTLVFSSKAGSGKGAFMLFLYQQGFAKILDDLCAIIDTDSNKNGIEVFRSALECRASLDYPDSACITAKLVNVNQIKKARFDDFIDDIVEEANSSLISKTEKKSTFQKDLAIQKIRHLSTELIENVIEHAYVDDGTFIVFAKIRAGRNYSQNDKWEINKNNEIKWSHNLQNWEDYSSNHGSIWIEIFFSDMGKGLFSNIENWKTLDLDAQALLNGISIRHCDKPLRVIGHKILSGGFSKSAREGKKSLATGLQLIHETLKNKEGKGDVPGDFVRILTGTELMGAQLPFEVGSAVGGNYKDLGKTLPEGTHIHV